jgi:hypothetical protein
MLFLSLLGFSVFLSATSVSAVTAQEQSERLQLIYAHLLDFRSQRPPVAVIGEGQEWEVELLHRPEINNRIGNKQEPVEGPPILPRFRFRQFFEQSYLLGIGLQVPVEVMGYRYSFLAGEIGYQWEFKEEWATTVRTYVARSIINGPITMTDAEDLFETQQHGVDTSWGFQWEDWLFSGGFGHSSVQNKILIEEDGVMLDEPATGYMYFYGGIGYMVQPDLRLQFMQYSTDTVLRHWAVSVTLLR